MFPSSVITSFSSVYIYYNIILLWKKGRRTGLKAPKNIDIGKDGFEDLDKFWDVVESKLYYIINFSKTDFILLIFAVVSVSVSWRWW